MSAKLITEEYVAELRRRISAGETPKKDTSISSKEFVKQMLPDLKVFLDKGYSYKEIAEFFGCVGAADLKKALARDEQPAARPSGKPEKKATPKAVAKAVAEK